MSLKNEIEIDYLNRKTKVSLPEDFSDFCKLCKKTFFISDSRSNNMSFIYFDEEKNENTIEEEEYQNENVRKADYWKLIIDDNMNNQDEINNQLIMKKNVYLNSVKNFKVNLLKQYNEKLEEEIKKRNEEHKKNIEKIKENYKDFLEAYKDEIKKTIKKNINDNLEKIKDLYNGKIELTNKALQEDLKSKIDKFGKECEEELNKVKIEEIGDMIEEMKENVQTCMNEFNNAINRTRTLIINNVEKECNCNEKEVKFSLEITNKIKDQLKGNYILEIKNSNDIYNVNVDLSDINFNEKKSKEICFCPPNKKIGTIVFDLVLKENEKNISNNSKLKLKIKEIGSIDDMLG